MSTQSVQALPQQSSGASVLPAGSRRAIGLWLLLCCAMVFVMVVIGGVTRLTQSGLSMVEWQPFTVLPPLSETQWLETFENYRQFPEYQKRNLGMSLEEFKAIYWPEYIHRMWGRLIGVVFLIPFLYFLIRGRIRGPLVPQLATIFALGALQGALGWYMVKSGLVDMPYVSQYRLTAHLGMAFLIYVYMLWVAMGLLWPRPGPTPEPVRQRLRWPMRLLGTLVVITVLSGGLVAGLKAGYIYNTFPLMDGHLLPPGFLMQEPAIRNVFENPVTVQFNHRLLAMLVLLVVAWTWWRALALGAALPPGTRLAFHALLAAVGLQLALGISTLLLKVPVALGAAHQGGAAVLLTALLAVLHQLYGRTAR